MEEKKEVVVVPVPKVMRKLRYATDREKSAYMRMRQEQNLETAQKNPNENWMAERLRTTSERWKRQLIWGFRVFDFWCGRLGIAVEVDGPGHDPDYDAYRDEYNYRRSGIVVLRVRNMNEADAANAIERINGSLTWSERRHALGIDTNTKKGRRWLVNGGDRGPGKPTDTYEFKGDVDGKFLIRRKGKIKVAHVWCGDDTACRMASTGGLCLDLYEVSSDNRGLRTCAMCADNERKNFKPKRSEK